MTPPGRTRPRPAVSLARGVSATGWYIASSMIVFLLGTLFVWAVEVLADPDGGRVSAPVAVAVAFALGATVIVVTTGILLARYRRDGDLGDVDRTPWAHRLVSAPLLVGLAGSTLLGVLSGSVLFGCALAGSMLCLVRWERGIRWRGVVLLEIALVCLWFVELAGRAPGGQTFLITFFAVMLPAAQALSLWTWDVVLELDRARRTEARLAAVQERLRLAGELHDLQGHHLQVIALQLELAERMIGRDQDAAADQIRLARASVDEARQGTRALAGRFRGVPLPDELANAADLLRAAGLDVVLQLDRDAAAAPADLLGPVVREATTNILKHGGGRWTRMGLARHGGDWRLTVANDIGEHFVMGSGAGLEGIAHRVSAAGGDASTRWSADRFDLVVTIPAEPEGREL